MHPRAVTLIAERLSNGVLHPGDPSKDLPAKMLLPMPGFKPSGMSDEMAAHFAAEAGLPPDNDAAQMYAEALVASLDAEGLDIIDRSELGRLRFDAAPLDDVNPAAPTVAVHLSCNRQEMLTSITVGRAKITTPCGALRGRIEQVCKCQ